MSLGIRGSYDRVIRNQRNSPCAPLYYYELCKKGIGMDFGKTQKRLFPVEHAPFYACRLTGGAMFVCMGGLGSAVFSGYQAGINLADYLKNL